MALADYFERHLIAASQVISGFDRGEFEARVGGLRVGLSWPTDDVDPSTQALLDMSVRLLARFYPALALQGPAGLTRDRLEELALAINPRIDLARCSDAIDGGIAVGSSRSDFTKVVHVGASGWTAYVDAHGPCPNEASDLPYGAGAAACLAAANVFRWLLLDEPRLDQDLGLYVARLVADREDVPDRLPEGAPVDDDALIGAGAIGNAAAWALARSPFPGKLAIVDHESIELSNIQRYVLADRRDEGAVKVEVVAKAFVRRASAVPIRADLAAFVADRSHHVGRMLVALDTAADRRAAQASLPRWIANAWTQVNDLGLSVHPSFGSGDACVSCLYLPTETSENDDVIVSRELHIPEHQQEVRTLLHTNAGVSHALLEAIAEGCGADLNLLAPYEHRSIRDLYVEGFCGGVVLPLGSKDAPRAGLHVPLAHQSALAGVLLAAALELERAGFGPEHTVVCHLDPSRTVPPHPLQRARARDLPVCICRDPDYVRAWRRKYSRPRPLTQRAS